MRVAVTGGLGFIGSAVVRRLLTGTDHVVLNIDKETYAATRGSVAAVSESDRYHFAPVDIADGPTLKRELQSFGPDAIIHLAAETHVDRSIDGPGEFIRSNVTGTYELLEAARSVATTNGVRDFRFLHVSTDEVFGALAPDSPPFNEDTSYDPRSPYSASKASADHLVRAWNETFGLETMITNCSNNYGEFQFPEKLIPLMVLKAMANQPLPVYGSGENIRDWLLVNDHAAAIEAVLIDGQPGETYLVGGNAERTNLQVVELICDLVDEQLNPSDVGSRRALINFVADRPGHDLRYAVDSSKIQQDLGWKPSVEFEEGLRATVRWYLQNDWWWRPLSNKRYGGQRLGVETD